MALNEGGLKKRRSSLDVPPNISGDLRILIFGDTDHFQLLISNSILNRTIFRDAEADSTDTMKNSGTVLGRNVTLVNTPDLSAEDLTQKKLKKELRKAVCFSSPGPHVILFVLHPLKFPSNATDIFKPVMMYFGESILKHTIIVLYHEGELSSPSRVELFKKNRDFRELIERCGQRYHFYNGQKKGEGERETAKLLEKIDQVVDEHGMYSNLEFEDVEKRIEQEERFIQKQRQKEMRIMVQNLKETHSGEDLNKTLQEHEEKIRLENRGRAEVAVAEKLGFALKLVDYAAAVAKGAAVGAVCGAPLGTGGVAGGAVIGAAMGFVIGGAAGAAWDFAANSIRHTNT